MRTIPSSQPTSPVSGQCSPSLPVVDLEVPASPPGSPHLEGLKTQVLDALKSLAEYVNRSDVVTGAEEVEALEREIVHHTDQVAGLLIGYALQQAIESVALQEEIRELLRVCPKRLKNQGRREVCIHPLRGEPVRISTSYFSRQGKKGGRKKSRRGTYPALVVLGLYGHYTPGLAAELSFAATVTSSYDEAQQLLHDRGHSLDRKTLRSVTMSYGARARAAVFAKADRMTESLTGRRVVIATDGGRMRIRQKKKGPKTSKGRHRYHTTWREPKLLIIYVVTEQGKHDRSFAPFLDGTLQGPDAVFWLLAYYLKRLQVHRADQLLFIADGARWIWKRVGALMRAVGCGPEQYAELIDFYHAVEHLGRIANLQPHWTATYRKQWLSLYRRHLLNGAIEKVLAELRCLCWGTRTRQLKTECEYFVKNQGRMNYARLRQQGLPIGSGAIESAVRRVVNLKLKGASSYWLADNAETMLFLRSYLKAGRWQSLKQFAYSAEVPLIS